MVEHTEAVTPPTTMEGVTLPLCIMMVEPTDEVTHPIGMRQAILQLAGGLKGVEATPIVPGAKDIVMKIMDKVIYLLTPFCQWLLPTLAHISMGI